MPYLITAQMRKGNEEREVLVAQFSESKVFDAFRKKIRIESNENCISSKIRYVPAYSVYLKRIRDWASRILDS